MLGLMTRPSRSWTTRRSFKDNRSISSVYVSVVGFWTRFDIANNIHIYPTISSSLFPLNISR
jgi:hypothetical protein